jgi:AcrR family transcriptional regulator
MVRSPRRRATLSREDWLDGGLELLAQSGPSAMTVSNLARELGVTRGSFYWHFDNVAKFQNAMFDVWQKKMLSAATTEAKATTSPVKELLKSIAARDLPKYDQAIRAWGKSNPRAAKAIRRADEFRLARLTEIFNAQGISLETAQMRAQIIVWMVKGTQDEANIRWRNKVLLELFSIATKD